MKKLKTVSVIFVLNSLKLLFIISKFFAIVFTHTIISYIFFLDEAERDETFVVENETVNFVNRYVPSKFA